MSISSLKIVAQVIFVDDEDDDQGHTAKEEDDKDEDQDLGKEEGSLVDCLGNPCQSPA